MLHTSPSRIWETFRRMALSSHYDSDIELKRFPRIIWDDEDADLAYDSAQEDASEMLESRRSSISSMQSFELYTPKAEY